jgi:hypothetical protein
MQINSEDILIVFAAICDCGEIFAGNYKHLGSKFDIQNKNDKNNYYTNGTFILLPLDEELPILHSE